MDEITLPSGARLKITLAPFLDAKALYQAILEELKGVPFSTQRELGEVIKDIVCIGFSSPKIEKALNKCFERVTYNDLKIDKDTFEPAEARGDYMSVMIEVTKANIEPFLKSLFAEYGQLLTMIQKSQA